MNEWTSAADLRAQVMRRWDKGELLAEQAAPADLFPLRLVLRVPSSADLSERFDAVRSWVAALQTGAQTGAKSDAKSGAQTGYRLEMRDVRHRVIGQNSLPAVAWVDTLDAALRLIGKTREARVFDGLFSTTRRLQPALLPWLQCQPLRALALAGQWPQLLDLVAWMQAHPRPGIYLREVDLPGIHSKFVEAQRSVLGELLDWVLPAEAIDVAASGSTQFARRYGFRDKPLRVRFRWLDPLLPQWVAGGDGDYTVSQGTFAQLHPAVRHVFITENEINFLSFPPLAQSLVVFGAGYGFEALASADWLAGCGLHYWGDIDTHGFAILDQLRAHHPHVKSFLMDRQTLLTHRPQWTTEPQPTLRDLPRLNHEESALYDDLRWLRVAEQPVRLEQERIGFRWVLQASAVCAPG